jgi:hypothetical protein
MIAANLIENTPSNGIVLYRQHKRTFATSRIAVAHNVIRDAGQWQGEIARSVDGIYIRDETHDFLVTGNAIFNPKGFTINVVGSRDGVLSDNLTSGGKPLRIAPNCVNVESR